MCSLAQQLQHFTVVEHENEISDSSPLATQLKFRLFFEVLIKNFQRCFAISFIVLSPLIGYYFFVELFADVATDCVVWQCYQLITQKLFIDFDLIGDVINA